MTQQDSLAFVASVLAELTSKPDIQEEDHLIRDLKLESLDVMDALQQVEDEFGLTIPTDILPRLQTVSDLVREVDRRLAAKQGARL